MEMNTWSKYKQKQMSREELAALHESMVDQVIKHNVPVTEFLDASEICEYELGLNHLWIWWDKMSKKLCLGFKSATASSCAAASTSGR